MHVKRRKRDNFFEYEITDENYPIIFKITSFDKLTLTDLEFLLRICYHYSRALDIFHKMPIHMIEYKKKDKEAIYQIIYP